LLGVPNEIIGRIPTGDVWDSKTDEDMIGAPYWFLELYQLLIETNNANDRRFSIENTNDLLNSVEDNADISTWIKNIKTIRAQNLHKYKVGSPARYIDVLPRTL
jgi:NH3-dependent NAD+ synthetase